jgi:hypothetical protein
VTAEDPTCYDTYKFSTVAGYYLGEQAQGVASIVELPALPIVASDIVATVAKVRGPMIQGGPFASGVSAGIRNGGRWLGKKLGRSGITGATRISGKLLGGFFSLVSWPTGAYNMTIWIQCNAGIIK